MLIKITLNNLLKQKLQLMFNSVKLIFKLFQMKKFCNFTINNLKLLILLKV